MNGSSRAFTKKVVVGNLIASWMLVFLSAWMDTLAMVLPQALAFIGVLISVYSGVGHLDFRKMMDAKPEVEKPE